MKKFLLLALFATQIFAFSAIKGDIVTWMLPRNLPHIGVISDKFEGQAPLVIHNIGSGVQEENILYSYKITGHFRLK